MRYILAVSQERRLEPTPGLTSWLRSGNVWRKENRTTRALVVGCAAGDDAEELSRMGLEVVAFDVVPAVVASAKKRFPDSRVHYEVADVVALPRSWRRAFDFVFEAYTFESLPPASLPIALDKVASVLAPGGTLLVLAHGRDDHEEAAGPPWPLAACDLERLEQAGLELVRFEDFTDQGVPPQRRFRAEYRRISAAGS
jgi:SAM-dependent methyltransferase